MYFKTGAEMLINLLRKMQQLTQNQPRNIEKVLELL